MPISKGEPWGADLVGDPARHPAHDDASLAELVWAEFTSAELTSSGRVDPERHVFTVGSGDLLQTIGGAGSGGLALPMDLCTARLDDGAPMPFVGHLIARRPLWHGESAAVMNAAWLGDWYLGPKAHPNDGLVDVTVGSLGLRERFEARRRASTGSHLPHPDLSVLRRGAWSHRFERPVTVRLDGRSIGSYRSVEVDVIPDAFTLVN